MYNAYHLCILENYNPKDLCIIAPDVGGVLRARAIAKRLNTDLAIIDKRIPIIIRTIPNIFRIFFGIKSKII